MKYAFIEDNQQLFSITRMCRVLHVKPSSYYDWLSRGLSDQQIHRNQSELLVRAAHSETRERYGVERLHAHLSEQGHDISTYMVRRISSLMPSVLMNLGSVTLLISGQMRAGCT